MLGEIRLKKLHEFIDGYSKEELIWINGYLSGLVSGNGDTRPASTQTSPATTVKKISLVYGTETGNAQRLATQLAAIAKKSGVSVKLSGLDQYRLSDLTREEYFIVVISTQGEGEPPIGAKKFYDHLHEQTLSLNGMKYAVLGLGDTAYPLYCKTGEDVDKQLEKFKANRLLPLQKCDVDYQDVAEQWFQLVLKTIQQEAIAQPQQLKTTVPQKAQSRKYYNGTIINNINLNDRGSARQTYHIEIATAEQIDYEPGDTIGIVPRNRQEVVQRIISLAGIDGETVIETAKVTATLSELLTDHLNICYLMTNTIRKYAALVQQEIPDTRMDLVDLLRIYPVQSGEQFLEVIKILLPISPRLYSIASSPAAHGENEVHITVARTHFLAQDEQRFGLCSEFLGDQPLNSGITFYVHREKNFKLPAPEKDIIMIGPGTGIAPFRSFISHRDATGATGRNWLFFGEQHFISDFLYQVEVQQWVGSGVLNKVDLAFSRDQDEKVYVQHKMIEKGGELFEWIEKGGSVYISGIKDPMGKEVEATLLNIIAKHGGRSESEAKEYLEKLKKEKRFEKDLY